MTTRMELIKEYTVSELVDSLKKVIEDYFYYVKVIGEISGLKCSANGHYYFNLKDTNAVINVVAFSGTPMKFKLEDGLKVKLYGRLTIYKDRSNYQIIAELLELDGEGSIAKLLEEKKQKLKSEGLFDRKRAIPSKLRSVGIITSQTGAAIKDIESRLKERMPLEVILFPAIVQGQEAEKSIINGLRYFNNIKNKPDVIVITRGGGSLEDLMCFNSEALARSIFASKIPTITAIGHEIDWTLVDFVSDLRLPTPTSVAEYISKPKQLVIDKIDNLINRIQKAVLNYFFQLENKLKYLFNDIVDTIIERYKNKTKNLNYDCIRLQKFNCDNVLKLGFALIKKNNKIINESEVLKTDDELLICFRHRKIKVIVKDF